MTKFAPSNDSFLQSGWSFFRESLDHVSIGSVARPLYLIKGKTSRTKGCLNYTEEGRDRLCEPLATSV